MFQLGFVMITKNKSNKNACPMQSAKATPEVRVRELRSNSERSEWRGTNKKSQLPTVDKHRNASFAVSVQAWSFRTTKLPNFLAPEPCLACFSPVLCFSWTFDDN